MLPSSVVCIIQRIRKTASGFEEIDSSSFNSSLVFFFAVSLLNLFDRGYKKEKKRKENGTVSFGERILETFPMSENFYYRNELK